MAFDIISVMIVLGLLVVVLVIYDLCQKKHAIIRNFPIIGHLRYLLEKVGPELRQYIVTSNNEELPFSRDQRRWIYATAKEENENFGFGSDNEMERSSNYIIIKHSDFPHSGKSRNDWPIPCAKILGGHRHRRHAFRPQSIVNVSGMSFGSLSGAAVTALNRGSEMVGCLQSTGEGGVSIYHDEGGDLIWNIGSGYFGCRDEKGKFSLTLFKETIEKFNIKAIEVKLSQGAKPGLGGVLPAKKVTREIAQARGIPMGQDCVSPSRHSAFRNVDEMLDFVELLAEESGLPVGIKSAVGELKFWKTLASLMESGKRGVDFIVIDGGEGGTGAAPLVFADHIALPFKIAFSQVYAIFAKRKLVDRIVFVGSGKLGFSESAILALALGCDLVSVGREAMMAVGCIQAQRCHTNRCPTGVATQSKWLTRGLDPSLKSQRLAKYIIALRKEIMRATWACGIDHPGLLGPEKIAILDGHFGSRSAAEIFHYQKNWGLPEAQERIKIRKMMKDLYS